MPGQLARPPLVEALLEIRWRLQQIAPDTFQDPVYRLLIGRLFDRIHQRFPYMQELPLAQVPIPDEMTPYKVKQQFRTSKNGWPLVQLGPGVATLNFTSPYSWSRFKQAAKFMIPRLVEAYTGADIEGQAPDLHLIRVTLRYINSFDLDWLTSDALEFMKQKLHTGFELPSPIRESQAIESVPGQLNLQIGYPLNNPKGQGVIRLATGHKGQQRGIIGELMVISEDSDVPQLTEHEDFWNWLSSAHDLIERWFFALIQGELHEQFKGEKAQ